MYISQERVDSWTKSFFFLFCFQIYIRFECNAQNVIKNFFKRNLSDECEQSENVEHLLFIVSMENGHAIYDTIDCVSRMSLTTIVRCFFFFELKSCYNFNMKVTLCCSWTKYNRCKWISKKNIQFNVHLMAFFRLSIVTATPEFLLAFGIVQKSSSWTHLLMNVSFIVSRWMGTLLKTVRENADVWIYRENTAIVCTCTLMVYNVWNFFQVI